MRGRLTAMLCWVLATAAAAAAPPGPALQLEVSGPPEPAIPGARPGCDALDIPDAPARAIRLQSGEVQLYATHFVNRVERGRSLLALRHDCAIVLRGAEKDDPAAFDDRVWIVSPWTDGRTIWAVLHDEFQGHRRPALCPTGRYMDCWYNALTSAVSVDGGRTFRRGPGRPLVATLPYRYDEVGQGHHGYFNPSNIVDMDGAHYMFAFATQAGLQRAGNCLLRTTDVATPGSWRGWDGDAFAATFIDPYTQPVEAAGHVCAPVAAGALRWPVTSLVRHAPSGLFIALMLDGRRDGGVWYATSADLLHWSAPALLLPGIGHGAWRCGDPAPIAYPSLLDPASPDRNFATVGNQVLLFLTRFGVGQCRIGMDRELIRLSVSVHPG